MGGRSYKNKPMKTTRFDPADYIDSPDAAAELLNDAIKSGDEGYLKHVREIIGRVEAVPSKSRPKVTPMQMFEDDKAIAKELGITLEKWKAAAAILETRGLPKRDALFGDRRCWPAVVAFLMHRAGAPDPFGTALRRMTEQPQEQLPAVRKTRRRPGS